MMTRRSLLKTAGAAPLARAASAAEPPVYVVLWFDTEDYVEPASDDALLRIARDLTALNAKSTFKVVGEKARTLEARGRKDVIDALALHDIGYHSENHSMPPQPAVYLRGLGFLEGAEEFYRREGRGVGDLRRLWGVSPSCYGQPGSSWGPQSLPALRRLGIPVYLDEGSHVGLRDQPFWYGGLLHSFHMGPYVIRPGLENESLLPAKLAQFDAAVRDLRARGGGLVSSYYHPCEFATTEFWDGVNFSRGANPERSQWRMPRQRTPEAKERAHRILRSYVEHVNRAPGVRFVTARDLPAIYESPAPPKIDRSTAAAHLAKSITFLETPAGALSPAELLLIVMGLDAQFVDGPAKRGVTTMAEAPIPQPAFERAVRDTAGYIRANRRLPSEIWVGSETLSLADFAATLAVTGDSSPVTPRRGTLEFEQYFATDPERTFSWVIHPQGFRAPELLELGRLQGWTLKPARLRAGR